MARRRYEPLNVFLNSRLVGQLRRGISGAISFRYDQAWLEWESVLPVSLSLPLREQEYSGAPVVAVFDNLLPDNADLRRQIAARAGCVAFLHHSRLNANAQRDFFVTQSWRSSHPITALIEPFAAG